ncbi:MAG: RdgB/HAM1 family non-canonical purine NTP pyrophosphatase [Clostridia bacterium]|nr:RdgB/HAM1 family non-canonical purine NTP pyrophosphatase [Clostridia bacterium]
MKKIIIATHNRGKLKEFEQIFKGRFEVYALPYNGFDGEVEETGTTFYENALLKAKYVYENTGELTIADDSGLCVNALNGAPGIYSARYGGKNASQKDKNKMLIEALADKTDRSAKFVCSLVLYGKNGVVATGTGEVKGSILFAEDGNGGFGYDPIFYADELGKSFGIATEDEKNSVSHRARAIQDLLKKIL